MTDKEKRAIINDMLLNYHINNHEIDNINLEIEELKIKNIGSISYDEKTGSTNVINNTIENQAISNEHKIPMLINKIRVLEIANKKIDNSLLVLTPKERTVIDYKYFEYRGRDAKFIANKLSHCESWVSEITKKALNKMARVIIK